MDIQYPFLTMNTDRYNTKRTRLWSFLDIHKKKVFLFDNFGIAALKELTIQDDRKIINILLYNLKIFNKSDNKITLISLIFLMKDFEKKQTKLSGVLSTTAIDLFHVLNEFGKRDNIEDEVKVHL